MTQTTILHVEDDSDDAFFVQRALRNALPQCLVQRVKDGREAIDYLAGKSEVPAPKVDLVLLDLKLPDVDGFEVLEWIRSQEPLKDLQVFILSGSSVEEDKERAHRLGANAYFVKTSHYKDVVAFIVDLLEHKSPANDQVLGPLDANSTERSPRSV